MTDVNATTPEETTPTTSPAEASAATEPHARTEEPAPAAPAGVEQIAAEPPAPPPAEQLIATAAAEHGLEHPPPADQLTPPPDEAAAAEPPAGALPAAPPEVAELAPTAEPQPVAETADRGEPAAPEPEPAPAAVSEPEAPHAEPAPAPKKPRKAKATAAAAAETTAEPAPGSAPAPDADGAAVATATAEPAAEPAPESKKKWYAVKIQSGREESIKAAIERKIKIEGLEPFFGQIVIPVEEVIVKKKVKVKNKKTGETTTQEKNVSKYNKKFPGYLFAEVEFNDEILYVFRETSGVGDFVGASLKRAPAPMTDAEVQSMLTGIPDKTKKSRNKVVVKLDVEKGDKVRIRNGPFVGSEGEVKAITEPKDPTENPKVTVVVTLWGRPVDVELDYWEVDKV